MAIQDDILSLFRSIGDAGDRATRSGRSGMDLYSRLSDLPLSREDRYAIGRELTGLGSRPDMSLEEEMELDPILASRVGDIISKYLPTDTIVDDTRAAEGPIFNTPPRDEIIIEELPAAAPREPVMRQPLPDVARPDLDAAAKASLRREMGLTSIPSRTAGPLARAVAAETGTPIGTDLRDILPMVEEDVASDIRSGVTEASITAMLSALPAPALAARAAQAGIRVTEAALSNPVVRQAVIRQIGTKMMRDPKTGRMLGRKDIGPFQPQPTGTNRPTTIEIPPGDLSAAATKFNINTGVRNRLQELLREQATTGGAIGYRDGGNIRDKIMKTYGGM